MGGGTDGGCDGSTAMFCKQRVAAAASTTAGFVSAGYDSIYASRYIFDNLQQRVMWASERSGQWEFLVLWRVLV